MSSIYLSVGIPGHLVEQTNDDEWNPSDLHQARLATDACRHANAWALTPRFHPYPFVFSSSKLSKKLRAVYFLLRCSRTSQPAPTSRRSTLLYGAWTFLHPSHKAMDGHCFDYLRQLNYTLFFLFCQPTEGRKKSPMHVAWTKFF